MSHIFFAGVLELSLETYCCQDVLLAVFSSPEPKAQGEVLLSLTVRRRRRRRRPSVHPSVHNL